MLKTSKCRDSGLGLCYCEITERKRIRICFILFSGYDKIGGTMPHGSLLRSRSVSWINPSWVGCLGRFPKGRESTSMHLGTGI